MAHGNKIKPPEFTQPTITRMNVNSFLIKSWLVARAAALFLLSQKGPNKLFLWFGPFASIFLWKMDGFFQTTVPLLLFYPLIIVSIILTAAYLNQ